MSERALVIDTGAGTTKAGFAGEATPHVVFPTIVGHPRDLGGRPRPAPDQILAGDDALAKRGVLKLVRPISDEGYPRALDDVAAIWRHVFARQLAIAASAQPVLLCEAPLTPRTSREDMIRIMFDTFGVPALFLANQGVLALHATGRRTGVVLDLGEAATCAVPIHDNAVLTQAVQRTLIGGRHLTDYLAQILRTDRAYSFTTAAEQATVNDLKEQLGFVAVDFDATLARADGDPGSVERPFTLPDGTVITVGNERFRCAEVLFKPGMVGAEELGIHTILHDAIQRCDPALRPAMLANVVVVGGGAMFEGLAPRLQRELAALAPPTAQVEIVAVPDRRYAAWRGGAMLAGAPSFADLAITRAAYDAGGPSVFQRRSF